MTSLDTLVLDLGNVLVPWQPERAFDGLVGADVDGGGVGVFDDAAEDQAQGLAVLGFRGIGPDVLGAGGEGDCACQQHRRRRPECVSCCHALHPLL